MSDRTLKVETGILTNGDVVQMRDVLGDVTYRYVNLCAEQMDAKVRESLIALGWTPPTNT